MGVEDTYIHSDVNFPLWHRLIQEHRLGLTSGVPAEQPKHIHQVVSDTASTDDKIAVTNIRQRDRTLTEFTQDNSHSGEETAQPGRMTR